MPIVKREARYVSVAYELCCGFERAEALLQDAMKKLKNEPGVHSMKDDTRGWDGDKMAVVVVDYRNLEDANRLDATVRGLLGRTLYFRYEAHASVCYGRDGPSPLITASTSVSERPPQSTDEEP